MKKLILTVCLLWIASLTAFAQKEANNWFFGYGCGITWNTTQDILVEGALGTTPNAVLYGLPTNYSATIPISTWEGSFALSDANGEVLFYSDGTRIWNKNHQVMTNGSGLTGHNSSCQSGIVIPYPEHAGRYMAITIPAYENRDDPMAYSIVDMSLSSGLGGVVSTEKNKSFTGSTGIFMETVMSVKHSNGTDYWVIAPEFGGTPTHMSAWLVTKDGVAASPVVSPMPGMFTAASGSNSSNTGYMKISPDGKYFVWVSQRDQKIACGRFDSTTGIFSDIQTIDGEGTNRTNLLYGVEFSASGEYVYMTSPFNYRLYVYKTTDLIAGIGTNYLEYYIPGEPGAVNGVSAGAIQLGPDGRMYMAVDGGTFLYIIDNPEDYGSLRIYKGPSLGSGRKSGVGLPTFSASWWDLKVGIETDLELPVCKGTEIEFTANLVSSDLSQVKGVKWDFGDGTVIDDSPASATMTRKYTYKKAGVYTVILTPYDASDNPFTSQIETLEVKINSCALPVNHNISVSGF